jgi:hypothetical protein
VVPASSEEDGVVTPMYLGAPWFQAGAPYAGNFPDPHVVRVGSTYWAYSTSTGGPSLPAMSSNDLRTWTARPAYSPNPYNADPWFNDAMPIRPTWAEPNSGQWAPAVVNLGGRWVAYSAWEDEPGRRCISVATGASPTGPFTDVGAPLQCDWDRAGSIDPEPFIDANGTPYLLWKSEGGASWLGWLPTKLWARRLSADGTKFAASDPRVLLETQGSWEQPIIENPSMIRHSGSYWLLYSANEWASPNYAMGVARCDTPIGPCVRTRTTTLIPNNATQQGAGGGTLFTDTAGRLRIGYHAWNTPYSSYPAYPNCEWSNTCRTQGQRFFHVDGLIASAGTLTPNPIGNWESASAQPGAVRVSGWAIDPSLAGGSSRVRVTAGAAATEVAANLSRTDVGAAYAGHGNDHGYNITLTGLAPGAHSVCVTVLNVGAGVNTSLGCRNVTVPGGSPFGAVDVVTAASGSVSVAGWSIDPDTAAAIDVHVYVGAKGVSTRANLVRSDVGQVYPAYGPNHGYSTTLTNIARGTHQVCVYGINVGVGANSLLGCRSVTVR